MQTPSEPWHTWTEHLTQHLQKLRRPVAHIEWQAVGGDADLIGSRMGGPVYWPDHTPWPVNRTGEPLVFLAQLNLGELPALLGFPRQGLLQFWIDGDGLYGLDFDTQAERVQHGYRVVYWPHPERRSDWQHPAPSQEAVDDLTPHNPGRCFAMRFRLDSEVPDDWEAVQVLLARLQTQPLPDGLRPLTSAEQQDWLAQYFDRTEDEDRNSGSKVGGYPFFTQSDPREAGSPLQLLLQLDSDDSADLMWGDSGVGHWFIDPADLARAAFDRVLYNWDCC